MNDTISHSLKGAATALRKLLEIDQIAFYARNDEDEAAVKASLGLENAEWIEDRVVAQGLVGGRKGENEAKLLFNYDNGIEVEILRYLDGPNYCDLLNVDGGNMCHIGMHVKKGTPLMSLPVLEKMFPFPIVQQVNTLTHTNPFLLSNGRKYRYTIYDSTAALGTCLKVIERIESNG